MAPGDHLWAAEGERRVAEVAAAARTLHERLAAARGPGCAEPGAGDALLDERAERWCERAAGGDRELWRERLRLLGYDDPVEALRAASAAPDDPVVPAWTATLRALSACARQCAAATPHDASPCDPAEPLPFEDVLLPAVLVARAKLRATLPAEHAALLNETAHRALERELLRQTVRLAADALLREFDRVRPEGCTWLGRWLGPAAGADESRERYRAFADGLLRDGLLDFFAAYPVLARALATAIESWAGATAAMLENLADDLAALTVAFGTDAVTLPVCALEPGLSDAHGGGRSVAVLTFASGRRLVYKPRSLAPEAAFRDVLLALGAAGAPFDLWAPRVVDRGAHGWMEYVAHAGCADEAALQRFFRRAGALLCVLDLLGANDCHADNLIAGGEHFVLVDAETLLQPRPHAPHRTFAAERFWSSVMRTGLLPRWQLGPDGAAYDLSALGATEPHTSPWPKRRWLRINSDTMHATWESATIDGGAARPLLGDTPVRASDYTEEIAHGFAVTYRFLLARRDALLARNGPLRALRGLTTRFLFRDTSVYYGVAYEAFAPDALRDGIDHGIELEALAQAHLGAHEPGAGVILASELRAVTDLDVPAFAAFSDATALLAGDERIDGFFAATGHDALAERIAALDESALRAQLVLVRGALHAHGVRTAGAAEDHDAMRAAERAALPPSDESLHAQAGAIAAAIRREALASEDGAHWIGFAYLPSADRLQLAPLGESAYDGNAGIAAFLAAYGWASGEPASRELALAALLPLRATLRDAQRANGLADRLGIGGIAGCGSLAHALVRAAALLDEPVLLDDAVRAAALITPQRIAADAQLDVVSGAAGAALALLAVFGATGAPAHLERALACGEHLLGRREAGGPSGARAWRSPTRTARSPVFRTARRGSRSRCCGSTVPPANAHSATPHAKGWRTNAAFSRLLTRTGRTTAASPAATRCTTGTAGVTVRRGSCSDGSPGWNLPATTSCARRCSPTSARRCPRCASPLRWTWTACAAAMPAASKRC